MEITNEQEIFLREQLRELKTQKQIILQNKENLETKLQEINLQILTIKEGLE